MYKLVSFDLTVKSGNVETSSSVLNFLQRFPVIFYRSSLYSRFKLKSLVFNDHVIFLPTEFLNVLMTKTEIIYVPPNTCRVKFADATQNGHGSSTGCAINKSLNFLNSKNLNYHLLSLIHFV